MLQDCSYLFLIMPETDVPKIYGINNPTWPKISVEKKGRHGQESQKGRRTVRQIHNQNHTCEIYENGRYSVLTHNIWGKNIGRTTKNQSSVPFLKSQAEPLKKVIG